MTNMGFEYRNTTRKNKCRIMGHTQQRRLWDHANPQ